MLDTKDNCGKHSNHSKVEDSIKNLIREHIQNFLARESHFSCSINSWRKYLNSSLNVSKMHIIFLIEHPDFSSVCKYFLYSKLFNYEFNISFGFPRSDICDTCKKQQVEIKAAELNGNKDIIKHKNWKMSCTYVKQMCLICNLKKQPNLH